MKHGKQAQHQHSRASNTLPLSKTKLTAAQQKSSRFKVMKAQVLLLLI